MSVVSVAKSRTTRFADSLVTSWTISSSADVGFSIGWEVAGVLGLVASDFATMSASKFACYPPINKGATRREREEKK